MNKSQMKLAGILILILGIAAILGGLAGIYSVHDTNSQLDAINNLSSGMLGGMAGALGHPMKQSYTGSVAISVIGFMLSLVGWKLFGKGSKEE